VSGQKTASLLLGKPMTDPAPPAPAESYLRDSNGNKSSKRLAAAFCLVNFAALSWVGTLSSHQPPELALWLWAGLAFGCLGLTIPEWLAKKGTIG
jgi:hypothetical protein